MMAADLTMYDRLFRKAYAGQPLSAFEAYDRALRVLLMDLRLAAWQRTGSLAYSGWPATYTQGKKV